MAGKTRLTPYKEALSRKVQCLLKVLTTGKTKSIEWAHRCGARVCGWWHAGVAAARDNGQRGRAFLRRHPTGLKVIVGVTVLVLVGVALWKVPQSQVANLKLSDKERIELEDKTRGTLAQIFGGIAVLGGLFVTARGVAAAWRTVQVNEEGQITERFTRAIGNPSERQYSLEMYNGERLALEGSKPYCYSEAKGEGVMSTPVGDLFRQASALDEHDRATLAGLLLESLEHDVDKGVEAAWQEEIERRLTELDANSVELVPWEEVKAKLMRGTGA